MSNFLFSGRFAAVIQWLECHLAKVVVVGSNPIRRSLLRPSFAKTSDGLRSASLGEEVLCEVLSPLSFRERSRVNIKTCIMFIFLKVKGTIVITQDLLST